MDRNGKETAHSRTSNGSENGRTDRKKTAAAIKKMCQRNWHRFGARDDQKRKREVLQGEQKEITGRDTS